MGQQNRRKFKSIRRQSHAALLLLAYQVTTKHLRDCTKYARVVQVILQRIYLHTHSIVLRELPLTLITLLSHLAFHTFCENFSNISECDWRPGGGIILSSLHLACFLYTRTFSWPAKVPLSLALVEGQKCLWVFPLPSGGLVACRVLWDLFLHRLCTVHGRPSDTPMN